VGSGGPALTVSARGAAERQVRQAAAQNLSDVDRLIPVILHASDLDASLHVYRDVFEVPLSPGENDPVADPWMGAESPRRVTRACR